MKQFVFLEPGQGHGLAPKVRTVWLLQRIIFTFVTMIILSVVLLVIAPRTKDFSFLTRFNPYVILTLWFCIFHLPGFVLLKREFERWRYQVTPDFLTVSHGVFSKSRTILPLAKLQHIEMKSGVFETRMGIVQVEVHNAGGLNTIKIPGVTVENANQLRDEVMRLKGTSNDSV